MLFSVFVRLSVNIALGIPLMSPLYIIYIRYLISRQSAGFRCWFFQNIVFILQLIPRLIVVEGNVTLTFIVTLPEFRETDVSFKLFIYLVVCCFSESVCCVYLVVGPFVGIIMNYVYHYWPNCTTRTSKANNPNHKGVFQSTQMIITRR